MYLRIDAPWLFKPRAQVEDIEPKLVALALAPSDKQQRIALVSIARKGSGMARALACARLDESVSNLLIRNNLSLLPRHLRGLNWKP